MRASTLYAVLASASFVPSAVGIYDPKLYVLVPVGYGLAIVSIWLNVLAHRTEGIAAAPSAIRRE